MLSISFRYHADAVRSLLLAWFEKEGRSFPWRSLETAPKDARDGLIHDPYVVLVSEIMLQQTQSARVVEKLPEFLKLFPDVRALAAASTADLLRAWKGMGYNSRAVRLRDTARAIVEEYGGEFPSDARLETLPGVGRYTANALRCFAFGLDVPVVDVNIVRVLSRLFYRCHTPALTLDERSIEPIAEALTPPGEGYRWHQALMDLGATICTARAPRCGICPLLEVCLSAGFPHGVALFDARRPMRSEPTFLGEPRRVWRGRIVDLLRDEHDGLQAHEIMQRVVSRVGTEVVLERERRGFLAIVEGLVRDGLVTRYGVVREGEVGEGDMIRLPE